MSTSEDSRSLSVKQQPRRGSSQERDHSSVASKDTTKSTSSRDTAKSTSDSSVVDLKMELALEISKFIADIEYQLDHVVPMSEICFVGDIDGCLSHICCVVTAHKLPLSSLTL